MHEVELRGLLSKQKYQEVISFLEINAANSEDDDKTAYFYDITNGILKVVDEESKSAYKLSLKIGDEYSGKGMEEIEVYLKDKASTQQCINLLNALGYNQKSRIKQSRKNYLYKGVAVSIKHTPSWQHHFEAEMLVKNKDEASSAHQYIQKVCKELGIVPLSPAKLKAFIADLETK